MRTSHETRGELAAWGRSSRMSAVSRHKGGHFHFLVCHLPLPHGLPWVCLLSPWVYVEAASLLCLPPGDSGKLPAASLSPVVPVRAGKGLSSLGTCLFFATAAEPSQPSVSWPPDGLAPGPQAAWRWSRSTEDETAPARLHLPQPPPAGSRVRPCDCMAGVWTCDLSLVIRANMGPCWGFHLKRRHLLGPVRSAAWWPLLLPPVRASPTYTENLGFEVQLRGFACTVARAGGGGCGAGGEQAGGGPGLLSTLVTRVPESLRGETLPLKCPEWGSLGCLPEIQCKPPFPLFYLVEVPRDLGQWSSSEARRGFTGSPVGFPGPAWGPCDLASVRTSKGQRWAGESRFMGVVLLGPCTRSI